MLLPEDSLTDLLGDRTAKALAKHLGLRTVSDLLQHFPRRYSTRGELTPIAEIPVGEAVTVVADVVVDVEGYCPSSADNRGITNGSGRRWVVRVNAKYLGGRKRTSCLNRSRG